MPHRNVSAETPPSPQIPGHPADPARCHVQDGPAISDHARQPDQDQPPAAATEPQDLSWRPTVTEVDIMAAIREQSDELARNQYR